MRLVGLAVLAACSSQTALPIDSACNPLGANACLTPWPSSAFEVDDPATATGRRLALPDRPAWNDADGFSPAAPLVMSFPGGVSPDGLPPSDNLDRSLDADSPTVILDMTTGERVAHFAEVDMLAAGMPDSQALLLRPAARLAGGHRYAAAITKAVHAPDGDDLPVPAGFAALRDGRHTDHELLEAMRPRFGEVLDALDDAGFPADDLVVAWDFTVASDAYVHADMLAARDSANAALDAEPQTVSVTSGVTGRTVTGTFDAPLVGGGIARAPFTASVPACAPTGMVLYAGDDPPAALAAELCMVVVSTDPPALADLAHDGALAQRLVTHIALARAMRTVLAPQLLGRAAPTLAFYGVGLGAVFGTALVAYEPSITRAVLAGGGANFSTLLERSAGGPAVRAQLAGTDADPLDATLALGLAQMRWDLSEGAGVADSALTAHAQLLVEVALGDGDVANLASYWLARSLKLPVRGPTPFAPWGLTVAPAPLSGSALVILDGGAPRPPAANLPATGDGMRELARADHRRAAAFLATGVIE